jgi:hypothetical protein
MALQTLSTRFDLVDVGKRFRWGSIDPIFQKVDETTAIRVSNAFKYMGKTYAFGEACRVRYRPVMHITTDGVNRLCGAVSHWAAHIFYATDGAKFDDGDWCPECWHLKNAQQSQPGDEAA